ncbi:MAG: 30S ribosome-binding factor RbfA [Lachnospiraceae bacterium]|jgi:ribosome-binding factor A|nr:30S ribosome-binding factor RbfA [Lachnospiraceae bacterium]MDD4525705.1 30S ribosome-binding factor RbfA [Lachnospiraceae bacterium]
MKKNSVKNRRVNDEVMRSLSEIIRNVKDPRVSPFTSILECEVAPDLKTCKIFVSVLGSDEDAKQTLEGLNSAKGFIRSELARDVNLRITPELRFIIDDSITYGVEMSRKIDDVIAADEAAEKARLQNNE